MKILILFGPDKFGGSFVIAEKAAEVYKQAGHDVIMVVKDPYSVDRYINMGYEVFTINSMKRKIDILSDIKSSYYLMKLFKKNRCDIIHSHTSKGGFYSRISKILCRKIKVIHTVHGYYKSYSKTKSFIFSMIEKCLLPFANITTFVNYEDYESTKSSKSKLLYIPNGVDVEYFECKRDFNEEIFHIIISARIVWEKGYRDIIELVKRLEDLPIKFHIVGEGTDESDVKSELERNHNVIFHGFVSDIRVILQKAHLNLLPSYREGLSLSILEAMASGIPTIAYDIRGNKELIDHDDNGYLCALFNVDQLEERVRYYYDNRNLVEAHGIKANLKVKQNYNSKYTYKLYLEAIEEIQYES